MDRDVLVLTYNQQAIVGTDKIDKTQAERIATQIWLGPWDAVGGEVRPFDGQYNVCQLRTEIQ